MSREGVSDRARERGARAASPETRDAAGRDSSGGGGAGLPELSVIVPTFGRPQRIEALLARLARQTLAPSRFEAIVVDDGSPEPVRVAGGHPYELVLLRQANAGPGAARNLALERARAPLVLILNDDAVPADDLLERHLAVHAENERGPRARIAALGTFRFAPQAVAASPFVDLLDRTDLLFDFSRLVDGALHGWPFFWTCNVSLPAAALQEAGGFDAARFRDIVEDVELGYRLERLGYHVLHRADLVAHHDHVWDREAYFERAFRLGRNLARMHAKHGDATVLRLAPGTPVDARSLGPMQATCETLWPQLAKVEALLARVERDHRGRPLPDELVRQIGALVARVAAVPFHRGVLAETTGTDPGEALARGAPKGVLTSVVVVSHGALDRTRRCVEALRRAADDDHPTELLVVDNGSSDGSREWLAAQPDIVLIANEANEGAPRARNRALERARGELVAFLDNDAYVAPGWLARLAWHLAVDPLAACVGPLSDRSAHGQQIEYRGGSSPEDVAACDRARAASHAREARRASLLSSFCLLSRTATVRAIGGFDERFSPWGFEDDDLSLRAALAVGHNRVALDVFVRHEPYRGPKAARHEQLLERNWARFREKWGLPADAERGDYSGLSPLFDAGGHGGGRGGRRKGGEQARRIDAMRDVIVLGSGRSGTSMLAGALAPAGYDLGGEPYPAREANPKGFFETAEVNGVNELVLAASLPRHPRWRAGQRWLAEMPLGAPVVAPPLALERIARLVERSPWLYKDPRFCLTLPVWRPHLGDAVLLCVFRDPAVTAASIVKECATEPYLAGVDMTFDRALSVWLSMYAHVLRKHVGEGEWHFFHYDQLLTPEGLERLERATGARVARGFPEARLARSASGGEAGPEALELYRELCDLASFRPRAAARPAPLRGPETSEPPELSVVLCTYDRREVLARSLASLGAQTAPRGSFELVVVDDGSQDGTCELLEGWDFPVPARVLHRENGGLAAARNTGIAAARGRLLLFVNDDTIAAPDLVERHLARHALLGRPAAVLGTFEQPAEALDGALMRFLERANLVFRYGDLEDGGTYDYHRFWTCNVSVPAELVARAGGFDESFRHYGCEDTDLGYRLERLGCRVVFDASARANHDHVLDLDALERRTRLVARAFVRLFEKHPACLEHPDWTWVRDHGVESIDAWVGARLGRVPALRAAAAELARIDVGALEHPDAGLPEAAPAVLAALERAVRELSDVWWLDGFAAGLREFGRATFAEMRRTTAHPEAPATPPHVGSTRPDAAPAAPAAPPADGLHRLDENALALLEDLCRAVEPPPATVAAPDLDPPAALDHVRATAAAGEVDLATVEAIRLGAALAARGDDPALRAVRADLASDLGVLRWSVGDGEGSLALLDAALALDPGHELARANRAEVARAGLRPRWCDGPDANAAPTALNAWTADALELARSRIGLLGRDVLEVGGAIPPEAARETGARSWTAFYLEAQPRREPGWELFAADARRLPWPDASFDVAFSSCAFEHVQQLGLALAEIERVLRPGGALVTSFAPIWSYARGHHLWELDGSGRRIMFMDPVVPRFAHLLCDEAELGWYLAIALGRETGERTTRYVFRSPCINRLFEGDYRRLFERSGLAADGLEPQRPWAAEDVPSARLAAELAGRHPQGGDFATPGFRGVLRKTAAGRPERAQRGMRVAAR